MEYEAPTFKAIVVYQSEYTYRFTFPINILIVDLKIEIERKTGISFAFNYLYFFDENILEDVDRMEFNNFVKEKTFVKFENNAEYILMIYPREDYQDMLTNLDFIKCTKHNLVKGSMFCTTCKVPICEKCFNFEHKEHNIITDLDSVFDATYQYLYQFERKTKKTFGRTKASDLARICIDLEGNLDKYHDSQLDIFNDLSEKIDKNITKLKKLELIRIDNFIKSGINVINKFRNDTLSVMQLHKNLKGGSNKKDIIEKFINGNKIQKINILTEFKIKNSELIRDTSKVEGIIDKLENYKEHDVAKLLMLNKDYYYYLTAFKLEQILQKFQEKIKFKTQTESPILLIKQMEDIKSSTGESRIYCHNLNLSKKTSEGKMITKIFQIIEDTRKISLFNLDDKSISELEIKFDEDYFFYRNSRSINIAGKLYVSGGDFDGKAMNQLVEIDGETMQSKFLKSMDFGRSGHTLFNFDNRMIVNISGSNGNKTCEAYHLEKKLWMKLPVLNEDRIGPSLLILNKSELLCFFGKRFDFNILIFLFCDIIFFYFCL